MLGAGEQEGETNWVYVSDELTHFAGKGRRQEEQFQTLLQILKTGRLLPGGKESSGQEMWATIGGERLCTNEMFTPQVVCFCDIPLSGLGIHMEKYGGFGIAFRKRWLVGRGANPVFYLAAGDSPLEALDGEAPILRAEEFGRCIDRCYGLLHEFADFLEEPPTQVPEEAEQLHDGFHHLVHFFLQYRIFSYLKCFDPMLSEADIDNFYMEREWRVFGPVAFELQDVAHVIVPNAFREQVAKEIPELVPRLFIAEKLGEEETARDPR